MNANSMKIYAAQLAAAFATKTRDDGSECVYLPDAPEWMTDAVHAAHDGKAPDDVTYRMCSEIADRLTDRDPDEWDDARSEECDSLVDVYNADLSRWLASHLDRAGYVDEAIDEGITDPSNGIFRLIACGQLREYELIWDALASAIENQADDEPCAYLAGWNMPGYMPDNAPAGFETADDARSYIADEMRRYADENEETPDDTSPHDWPREAAMHGEAADECEAGSGEYGCTVGGTHYFVTKA